MRHEVITDLLDVLGLLLVAAGMAAAVYPLIHWACLALAGAVVLTGSLFASTPPWRTRKPTA